jgi:hypothetical protein
LLAELQADLKRPVLHCPLLLARPKISTGRAWCSVAPETNGFPLVASVPVGHARAVDCSYLSVDGTNDVGSRNDIGMS